MRPEILIIGIASLALTGYIFRGIFGLIAQRLDAAMASIQSVLDANE